LSFEFEFAANAVDHCGFVVDFGGLGELKRWLVDTFDHQFLLNADDPLGPQLDAANKLTGRAVVFVPDCSAEGLAVYAASHAEDIVHRLTDGRVMVVRCTCFEDGKNSATWRREKAA
jgi:6-pyruvoyltetrahydropterin/6-carboxytetrahydropterin synthase